MFEHRYKSPCKDKKKYNSWEVHNNNNLLLYDHNTYYYNKHRHCYDWIFQSVLTSIGIIYYYYYGHITWAYYYILLYIYQVRLSSKNNIKIKPS